MRDLNINGNVPIPQKFFKVEKGFSIIKMFFKKINFTEGSLGN